VYPLKAIYTNLFTPLCAANNLACVVNNLACVVNNLACVANNRPCVVNNLAVSSTISLCRQQSRCVVNNLAVSSTISLVSPTIALVSLTIALGSQHGNFFSKTMGLDLKTIVADVERIGPLARNN